MTQWVLMFIAHWVGDFVVQTDWQSKNKWHRWEALFSHVATYTVVMALWVFLVPDMAHPVKWLFLNMVAHLLTDLMTSQLTHYFSTQDPPEWHNFFVVVGADQTSHYSMMVTTWFWLATDA